MKKPKDGSIVDFVRRQIKTQARISYKIMVDGKHVDYLNVQFQLAHEHDVYMIVEGRLTGEGQCTTERYVIQERDPADPGAIINDAECFTLLEALQAFHKMIHDKRPAEGRTEEHE